MDKVMNLTFASSLTKLCEINSSFDAGVLKVCYPGLNKNMSFISKETIEQCIETMYNCPIVCNYDRETDSFGGHDMEIVHDSEGNLRLINLTTPVGVIPESAHWEWREFEEDDGSIKEYLCVDVLIWKRQEAYSKIKKDGVVAHSMEIHIKDGEIIDGVYYIKDFEFTAFALIGVTPCFESSELKLFSNQNFKEKITEMMQDLKESYSVINPIGDENIKKHSTEGGEKVLDEKMNLLAELNIDIESLDFSIEDFSLEELREKLENTQKTNDNPNPESQDGTYTLAGNVVDELIRSLQSVKLQREWGECNRYWFVDYDFEANKVYCWDTEDWLLYGFEYKMDGDSIIIDFDSKKRMKYEIVDFDEGEQSSPFAQVFSLLEQKLHDNTEWEAKYQSASDMIESMKAELGELRQFKTDTEAAIEKDKRDKLFAQFEDLNGVEEFETLRENCETYDAETLEEKCFAIRGRHGSSAKFAYESKAPKLKVEKENVSNEPYGGLVEHYLNK